MFKTAKFILAPVLIFLAAAAQAQSQPSFRSHAFDFGYSMGDRLQQRDIQQFIEKARSPHNKRINPFIHINPKLTGRDYWVQASVLQTDEHGICALTAKSYPSATQGPMPFLTGPLQDLVGTFGTFTMYDRDMQPRTSASLGEIQYLLNQEGVVTFMTDSFDNSDIDFVSASIHRFKLADENMIMAQYSIYFDNHIDCALQFPYMEPYDNPNKFYYEGYYPPGDYAGQGHK